MRDTHEGLGNGNPVRALLEDGLPGANIAQIGLAQLRQQPEDARDAIEAGNSSSPSARCAPMAIERAIEPGA